MTQKVLILGAAGAIAQHVVENLKHRENNRLTLLAKDISKISAHERFAEIIQADVLDTDKLDLAIAGKDIVYANLGGEVDKLTKAIVTSMTKNAVKRLIVINMSGIYDEVEGKLGEFNKSLVGQYIPMFRKAADYIEQSGLDYTIIRPTWLTDENDTEFELTQKNELLRGTEVSRKAVATYITEIICNPAKDIQQNLGINKPGMYGDKPSFM